MSSITHHCSGSASHFKISDKSFDDVRECHELVHCTALVKPVYGSNFCSNGKTTQLPNKYAELVVGRDIKAVRQFRLPRCFKYLSKVFAVSGIDRQSLISNFSLQYSGDLVKLRLCSGKKLLRQAVYVHSPSLPWDRRHPNKTRSFLTILPVFSPRLNSHVFFATLSLSSSPSESEVESSTRQTSENASQPPPDSAERASG